MDAFWLILIGLVAFLGSLLGGYQLNYNNNELSATDEIMLVVGKTIYSLSESEREVCVLEDEDQNRILSNGDNGCKYDVGDIVKVHVSANGNTVKELLR